MKKLHLLFMCVANSSRSQMAEALARQIFGNDAEVHSAGSKPTKVNAFVQHAMKEIGVDISNHYSKSLGGLSPRFLNELDYIIILSEDEVCPATVSSAQQLRWPFPDP